jgi:transposase-like protein
MPGPGNGQIPCQDMQMDLKTNLWRLNLNVPQVRGGVEFYPSALEKGIRSEKALKLSLAKMYIQGVSTKKRGLYGLKMITSDDHTGLSAARESVFPGVPWQRCQVHLQRNAVPYVPKISMRKKVANDIRNIFNAPDLLEREEKLTDIFGIGIKRNLTQQFYRKEFALSTILAHRGNIPLDDTILMGYYINHDKRL